MTAHSSEARTSIEIAGGPGGRILRGLLWAALAVCAAYVFLRSLGVLPEGALLPAAFASGPLLGWIERLPTQEARLLTAGASLTVGLVSLWAMRGGGSAGSRHGVAGQGLHVLEADERGLVVVANEGLEAVARTAAEGTPGVFEASVRARPSGRGVSLAIDIAVLEGADVRRAGTNARDRAVDAVERFVGLDVHKVRIRIDVLSPEELGRSVL